MKDSTHEEPNPNGQQGPADASHRVERVGSPCHDAGDGKRRAANETFNKDDVNAPRLTSFLHTVK